MENGSKRLARIVAAGALTGTLTAGFLATPAGAARDVASACTSAIPEDNFTDTGTAGSPIESAVDCQKAYGITAGQTATTYNPSGTTSRAQMATFMVNILKKVNGLTLPTNSADAFTDDETSVHEANINIAADLDIVTGTGGTNYNPGGAVTREQMATFMVNTLKAAGATLPASGPDSFTDDETSVHEANINILNETTVDIVDGTAATTYSPAASLSRGQMAFFNTRGLDLLVDQGKVTPIGGNPSATERPELVSAQIISTVTAAQASPSNPAGTTVRFVFDEQVQAPLPGSFFVYEGDGTPALGTAADAAFVDTANTSSVLARFNGYNTTALAGLLTMATVEQGAVTDLSAAQNPEGDAAVGAGGSTSLAAGVSTAPDLVSVGSFRESAAGGVAVDITFDEAAFTAGAGYLLVPLNGSTLPAPCVGPADPSATPSGGTSAGGNGTVTHTIVCDSAPATINTTTFNATTVARVVALAGAVDDLTGVGGNANPLQAADVANSGNAGDPSLVSAQFFPNGANPDQVLYTFSEPVNLVADPSLLFHVYTAGAVTFNGTAASAQRSPSNATQVLVTFANGNLDTAVGASVDAAAVEESTGATTNDNEADEVGVANTNTTTTVAGRWDGPDLVSVVRTSTTNAFGQTVFAISFTFDEDVEGVAPANFQIWLAPGDVAPFAGSACAVGPTEDTDSTVTCTAFTGASQSTLGAAVLGSVAFGGVDEQGAGTLTNVETSAPITAAA